MKQIFIYDTTLRDGSQTEGISYSLGDKIRIAKALDGFGIHFIEGGWPYSNPKDESFFAYFAKKPLRFSRLTAFGSTRYPHNTAAKDKNIKSLIKAGTEYVTIFGKTWDLHIKDVLKVSLEENLKMIYESIYFLRKKGRKVFYDPEHFFDGYKSNPSYALKTLKVAEEAGADTIILCDTNGGTLTQDVEKIVKEVKRKINTPLGIHAHNDSGLAVANSITAVKEGCVQVQGTFNGYGERCGNADLALVIPILQLKMGLRAVSPKKLKHLTKLAHFISEVSNIALSYNHPFVGRSAFAHKGGVHIDAVLKNVSTYEHISPESVGNRRRLLASELSGKSTVVVMAKDMDFNLDKKSPQAKRLLKILQNMESQGYQFEAADASLKMIFQRELKKHSSFFQLLGFNVIVEERNKELYSEATLKLKVGKKIEHTVSEGDGPVNALDNALKKALLNHYHSIAQIKLTDFKVRVLDEKSGTAAKVRVLITSSDEQESWSTIGVSENIIEASWQALSDAVEYKLLKDLGPRH